MLKKVLMAFDDPGGGLAVSSLIDRLSEYKNLKLQIYSGRLSEKFLTERKIEFNKIESQISNKCAEKIIDVYSPDILLTGTGGGNAEQELRNVAFERNIKSVVILDFWKDYSRRWLYATYSVDKMKDKVCVMDELTKKEMAEEKFNPENIIITGHPYLDKIFNFDKNDFHDNNGGSEAVLSKLLFLSQPLEIIGIKNYKVHPLKIFINALKKVSLEKKENFSLTIKLHPSEVKSEELINLVNENISENVNIDFAGEEKSLRELINESGIIIGFNTIAMFESRAMKKRTISLNAVPVKNSLMKAMSDAGIEIVKSDEEELNKCLLNNDIEEKKSQQNIFEGGLDNCCKVVLNELNLSDTCGKGVSY